MAAVDYSALVQGVSNLKRSIVKFATPEMIEQEIALYQSGKSVREISEITGRSFAGIKHRLHKAGAMRTLQQSMDLARSQGKTIKATPAMARQAAKLASQGKSRKQICEILNISRFTLAKAEKMAPGKQTRRRVKPEPKDTRIPYEVWKRMHALNVSCGTVQNASDQR